MNLRKERWFLGNIVIKCSFQMTLMRMKNLVYNKLGKENILHFVNSISILVIVTYFYHYSNSSYYYYYSYNYFFFYFGYYCYYLYYCYYRLFANPDLMKNSKITINLN